MGLICYAMLICIDIRDQIASGLSAYTDIISFSNIALHLSAQHSGFPAQVALTSQSGSFAPIGK